MKKEHMTPYKISVFAEKGGSGKSTFAVSMAYALGYPVIDLDAQQTSSEALANRDPATLDHSGLIVDFPANLDLSYVHHLADSDLIVIPGHATKSDLKGMLQSVKFVKAHARPGAKIALFGTAFSSAGRASEMTIFLRHAAPTGLPILGFFTNRLAFARASFFDVSAGEMDKAAKSEIETTAAALKELMK